MAELILNGCPVFCPQCNKNNFLETLGLPKRDTDGRRWLQEIRCPSCVYNFFWYVIPEKKTVAFLINNEIVCCPLCKSSRLSRIKDPQKNTVSISHYFSCDSCGHKWTSYAPKNTVKRDKPMAVKDDLRLFETFRYGCVVNANSGTLKYEEFELIEPVEGKKKFAVCVLFPPALDRVGRMNLWEKESDYKVGNSPNYTVWLNSKYSKIEVNKKKSWYGVFEYESIELKDLGKPCFTNVRFDGADYDRAEIVFNTEGLACVQFYGHLALGPTKTVTIGALPNDDKK